MSDDMNLVDLQQLLIVLNKAYDEESNALDKYYDQRRHHLQQLIRKKKGDR